MNPFRPSTHQGDRSSRKARKARATSAERLKLVRRQSMVENLEALPAHDLQHRS